MAPFIQHATSRRFWRLAALVMFLAMLPTAGLLAQSAADPEKAGQGDGGSGKVERVTATTAMAVTANPHATRAAVQVLRAGGNATDAMVAAIFVLNVVEPQSSGIGGGAFIVLHRARRGGAPGETLTIDGREETPAAARASDYLGADGKRVKFYPDLITGGRAVGVPGLLKALDLALKRHGSWSLARTLEPALRLAEEGFPVSERMAKSLARHKKRLGLFPSTRRVFFDDSGETLAEGTLLRQPDLAKAFRRIGRHGVKPFYRGEIARAMVKAIRQDTVAPGKMTLDDLAVYEAVLRDPVRATYRDYTLVGMGPPSSGATTVFQLLGLLEAGSKGDTPKGNPWGSAPTALSIHRFAQAARLAYADRAAYLGDPDFVEVPVAGLLEQGYVASRADSLDWEGSLSKVKAGRPPGAPTQAALPYPDTESPSTTHLVVVDGERNLVSITATVEQAFGSGMITPGWGFLLNNQLTDFALRPPKPGKAPPPNRMMGGRRLRTTALTHKDQSGGQRPRSSMAPTLVFQGTKPVLVLGSPGGSRIIQYVAEVLLRVLDGGMDVQAAIEAPHHTHFGGRTDLEPPFAATGVPARLEALGHKVRIRPQGSGLHAIAIDPATGRLSGGADPRREGLAMGF